MSNCIKSADRLFNNIETMLNYMDFIKAKHLNLTFLSEITKLTTFL